MVAGLLGNESSDSNRFTLVTPKSENDVRLQATLGNQNPTGLPVGVVSYKLDQIDKYCINHYNNYSFGKKLFNQIERVRSTIQYNPRLYPEIRPYHHKIVLSGLGYKLYYIVDDYNSVIVIYRLMKFYERY